MKNMSSQRKNTNVLWAYIYWTNETDIRNLQEYNMSTNMLEQVKYYLSMTDLHESTSQVFQPYCDEKWSTFADGGDPSSMNRISFDKKIHLMGQ